MRKLLRALQTQHADLMTSPPDTPAYQRAKTNLTLGVAVTGIVVTALIAIFNLIAHFVTSATQKTVGNIGNQPATLG
jgi:hypothetical protein